MKKLMNYAVLTAIIIAFFGTSSLVAQEWTKEQKEVWQVIENSWTKWLEKDIDAAFANVHDSYVGWNNYDPLPTTRTKWLKSMKKDIDMVSKADFDIEPARILIRNDVAVVHYYYELSFVRTSGDEQKMVGYHGKNAEFYVKEDGKWMLIGDMSYSKSDK